MPSVSMRALPVAVALALCPAAMIPGLSHAADVASALLQSVQREGHVQALIVMRAQAANAPANVSGGYLQRRRALVENLRATAEVSQADLRAWLDAEGVNYRPFWIVNMIQAELSAPQLDALAARTDVARVESNAPVAMREPLQQTQQLPWPESPAAIEWGVDRIRAPLAWAAGIRGQGVVVAGQDTGYQWDHPALKASYLGWNGLQAQHGYHWHDAVHAVGSVCGADAPAPCDDHNHGTHTMGTMVGDDGGNNRVGVAPAARWIGCRNMNAGAGTPATYIECNQWLLAPTDAAGQNPDPDRAPDVINNSWGCVPEEGCLSGQEIRASVDALVAGGIFFVASAGNDGSGCASITSSPAIYASAFVVGSTTSAGAMSGFSSRGPVSGIGVNKPDVVAPGSNVRSAIRNGGYGSMSGTSMAGPHVAGAAALVLAVNPALRGNPHALGEILQATSVPVSSTQSCGGIPALTFPNPVQGYGQIDAWAAVKLADTLIRDGFE